jgi:predicted phage-related endonuclease
LKERQRGITASDAGIVVGVSKYTIAHSLWLLKSGQIQRFLQ